MPNISKTLLRTDETMDRYIAEMRKNASEGISKDPFSDFMLYLVKEFEHWVIIENKYPYDAIAKVSHLILTKRKVAFDWNLINKEEMEEFSKLRSSYLAENYDLIWENLPRGQTIPGHFHLHLLVLKREEVNS